MELVGEQHDQRQAEPVARHRVERYGQRGKPGIERPPAGVRLESAEGQAAGVAQDDGEQH